MKQSHIILALFAALAVIYLVFVRGKKTPTDTTGIIGAPDTSAPPAPQAMLRQPATGKVPLPTASSGRIQWYANAKQARDAYWAGGGGGACSFIEGTGANQGQYGVLCP